MPILTAAQQAAIKQVRALAWNRSFTVETTRIEAIGLDYYDEPTIFSGTATLQGDWTWREQMERRGSPGGIVDNADLILATDIAYSGALVASGTRLRVEGRLCSILGMTPYPDSGELVLTAVRVA